MDRARVVAGFRRIRDRLRARGFTVVEVPGWETRGRSGLRGAAMVKHHTAGARSGGKTASLRVVTFGRAGLNNILCNWYRSRGPRPVAYIVGAGLAWHAGAGRYPGVEGNKDFGLEEENDGTGEPWTAEELALSQAIDEEFCREFGYPPSRIVEHSEWASDRKVDRRGPGLVRGAAWRARVTAALSKPKPVPTPDEEDDDMRGAIEVIEQENSDDVWLHLVASDTVRRVKAGDRDHFRNLARSTANPQYAGPYRWPLARIERHPIDEHSV